MTNSQVRMANMSRELSKIMTEALGPGWNEPADGDRVFKLKRSQSMYHYVGMVGRTRFCYTPHPDTMGNYWVFNEVRVYKNRKAKLGELVESWKRSKWVRCARRKTAISRAQQRYNTARKKTLVPSTLMRDCTDRHVHRRLARPPHPVVVVP